MFDPSQTKELEDRLSNPVIAADTVQLDRHNTNCVSPTSLPLRLADLEGHPTALEFARKREKLPSTRSRKEILHILKTNQVLSTANPSIMLQVLQLSARDCSPSFRSFSSRENLAQERQRRSHNTFLMIGSTRSGPIRMIARQMSQSYVLNLGESVPSQSQSVLPAREWKL